MNSILQNPKKLLAILEIVAIALCYYNILLWFPYYFSFIGFQDYASYLSIICPISIFFGGIFFESLMKLCARFDKHVTTFLILIFIFTNYCIILIHRNETEGNRNQTVFLYFMSIVLGTLALSGPYNRLFIKEIYDVTDGTVKMKYYIITLYVFFRCFFLTINFFSTGIILEHSKIS